MSETLFENFGDGSNKKTDPTQKIVNANGNAEAVTLNLGDSAATIVVNDNTDHIVILNKLVDWRSKREIEDDGSIDKHADGSGTSFTDQKSGFGIHIAAATGDADNGGRMLDGLGFETGKEANRIDIRDDAGNVSDELITLLKFAALGGDAGAADDNNLRVGEANLTGKTEDRFIEIVVDGKWSSDVIRIEGELANQLAVKVPEILPEATVQNQVDVKNRDTNITFKEWAEGDDLSIAIGGDGFLADAADGFAFDAGDFNRNAVNGNNDRFSDEDVTLAILAGVIEFNTGEDVFTDLEVDFGDDGLDTDTVVIGLTSTAFDQPTDFIVVSGTGVEAAIDQAEALLGSAFAATEDPTTGILIPDDLIA